MVPHWWLQSWFSDGAPMAASPTLRPIPGGRQVPEDGGVKGRDFGCSTLWLFHTLSYCLTWQNGCLQSLDENISVNLIHLNYSEDIHRRQRTGRLSRTWWHFPMLCSSINWVEMSGSPKIQTLHWSLIVFDVLNSESTMALEIPISDFLGKAFLCYAQASTEWKWVGRQRSRHCLAEKKKKKDIVWPRRRTPLTHLVKFSPAWHHTMFSCSCFSILYWAQKHIFPCYMINITIGIYWIMVSWTSTTHPFRWVFPLMTFRHTMFGALSDFTSDTLHCEKKNLAQFGKMSGPE